MSKDEMIAFVKKGTRTGHIATVRADGRPHVAPIWFVVDGDDIVFTSWHESVKVRNIVRTGYAALSIDDPQPPYAFVVVEGPVTIDPDPAASRHWATENGHRYMGAERGDELGARNGIEGEWVFRLTPAHWAGDADMTNS
jgi:PPOX class probable F420-dependent enzyme